MTIEQQCPFPPIVLNITQHNLGSDVFQRFCFDFWGKLQYQTTVPTRGSPGEKMAVRLGNVKREIIYKHGTAKPITDNNAIL